MQFCLPTAATQLAAFQQRWGGCQLCPLNETRKSVVLWRGYVPCDLLFLGEAPGLSEDREGYPFIGEAGVLLDSLIHDAWQETNVSYPLIAISNVICCVPIDRSKNTFREPEKEEIKACNPRLIEFISLAKPKVILGVGKVATSNVKVNDSFDHPASMLRLAKHAFPAAYLQAITVISEAIRKCQIK